MSNPPFEITTQILNDCTAISQELGRYDVWMQAPPKPELRRQNRIKTIQNSLAIEGNTLSLEQVTTLLDNKRVIGPSKDILEVQNAIRAYEQLQQYQPYSARSFLKAHSLLMKGLTEEAGQWRKKGVGIMKGKQITHVAPPADRVPHLMKELFQFIKGEKELHLLIRASVFHYELEFIHPFSDGNGRMGRLWQSVLLAQYHPLFEFLPVESIIREHQKDYYRALEVSDNTGHSTPFIEFSLYTILEALKRFSQEFQPTSSSVESRLNQAKQHFGSKEFSRKDYQQLLKTLSTATASRDLKAGVDRGLLTKHGDKALTRYCFILY